jgi:hypothetical protein
MPISGTVWLLRGHANCNLHAVFLIRKKLRPAVEEMNFVTLKYYIVLWICLCDTVVNVRVCPFCSLCREHVVEGSLYLPAVNVGMSSVISRQMFWALLEQAKYTVTYCIKKYLY